MKSKLPRAAARTRRRERRCPPRRRERKRGTLGFLAQEGAMKRGGGRKKKKQRKITRSAPEHTARRGGDHTAGKRAHTRCFHPPVPRTASSGRRLGRGLGALAEPVLEAAGQVLEVAHAAGARGLAADGLVGPVVWREGGGWGVRREWVSGGKAGGGGTRSVIILSPSPSLPPSPPLCSSQITHTCGCGPPGTRTTSRSTSGCGRWCGRSGGTGCASCCGAYL